MTTRTNVGIDLEFDNAEEADAVHEQLAGLWQRVEADGLIREPRAVVELAEDARR